MPPFGPYQRPTWTPPSYLRSTEARPIAPTSPSPFAGDGPIIDITPDSTTITDTEILPPKPNIDEIPVQQYSSIIPASFIGYKLTPQRVIPIAKVSHMDWEFDEPADDADNEVRVFVSISEEERAIIRRYGYHHEPLEKQVPLFDAADIANLQKAHERELETSDPSIHGALRLEHKQQLQWAEEQKLDLTIIDYLASPFRRQCADRFEATLTERKINSRLMEFKKKLEPHRG